MKTSLKTPVLITISSFGITLAYYLFKFIGGYEISEKIDIYLGKGSPFFSLDNSELFNILLVPALIFFIVIVILFNIKIFQGYKEKGIFPGNWKGELESIFVVCHFFITAITYILGIIYTIMFIFFTGSFISALFIIALTVFGIMEVILIVASILSTIIIPLELIFKSIKSNNKTNTK